MLRHAAPLTTTPAPAKLRVNVWSHRSGAARPFYEQLLPHRAQICLVATFLTKTNDAREFVQKTVISVGGRQ